MKMDVTRKGITLQALTKVYRGFRAVDNVTLHIEEGEIFGFLGPNGSGKTTTFLMILGFTEITQGTVSVFGVDPARESMEIKKTVAYLPDTLGFYAHMRIIDNLLYTGRLLGMNRQQAQAAARENLKLVGLGDAAEKRVSQLSRGMRQRLGIADLLMKKPRVLILDEPTLGLDPKGAGEFLELILGLSRRQGMTVLLSSHQLEHVQKICGRIAVFKRGAVVDVGTPAQLAARLNTQRPPLCEISIETPEEPALARLAGLKGVRQVRREALSTLLLVEREEFQAVAAAALQAGCTVKRMDDRSDSLEEVYRYYFGSEPD